MHTKPLIAARTSRKAAVALGVALVIGLGLWTLVVTLVMFGVMSWVSR